MTDAARLAEKWLAQGGPVPGRRRSVLWAALEAVPWDIVLDDYFKFNVRVKLTVIEGAGGHVVIALKEVSSDSK